MPSDRAPSLIREEIFGFDDIAYNAEFEDRGVRLPDLLEAFRAEFDDSEIRKEDLTRRFDPQLDDIYSGHHILGYLLTRSPRKFSIPSFQRPYSWDTGEHTEFWLDLIDDLSTVSSGHRIPEMYMGSIYLSPNGSEYDIIDGQQRMITFFVILKVIHKYMCILSDNEDSQFWDLVDEVYSEDGVLEDILYREDGSPVLKPKSDDTPYFRLLFKDSPHDIIKAVDEIEFQEDSQTWLVETILVDKLGLRQDNVGEILENYSVNSKSHKYYGTPHQRILRANRFYLDNIGEYIGSTLGINDSINIRGVEADDTSVTARVTTKGTPVADAHISLIQDGNIVQRKESDKYGLVRFDYDELDGEKEIRAEKFGEDDSISFESDSDFNTERPFIKEINKREGRIRILVIEDDVPVGDRTIEINDNDSTTNEDGIAEFDISDITIDEEESLKIRGKADRITVSDLDSLSEFIVERRTVDPEQSARVLLNLTQVLLHSMRTVVIEFNMDNPEYKIDVFQSLNDKGRDLDLADIIRARIIGTDDSLSDSWEQIYRRHEQDSGEIENLLENYLIATQGVDSASKNDIKALFNTSRSGNEDIDSGLYENPDEFLEEIDTFSKRYREILDHAINDLDGVKRLHHDSTVENALKRKWERIIGRLDRGVEVWEPFVLLVHKRFAEQDHHGEELIDILETVEKIVHRYSFYGEDISSTFVSPLFPEACRQYQSGRVDPFDPDEVRDSILIPNVPSELRGEQVLSQLVTKDNWQPRNATTILLRLADKQLEDHSTGQIVTYSPRISPDADITVEHIFPSEFLLTDSNHADNSKAWVEIFFENVDSSRVVKQKIESLSSSEPELEDQDKEDIKKYFVRDIGNMMLLSREINSSVQNRLFSKKIVYYYLASEEDLRLTKDYIIDNISDAQDIVSLIERFADEANLDNSEIKKVLGLLLGDNRELNSEQIVDAMDEGSITASELSETNYESCKETVRKLLSNSNGLDETRSDSIPDIVKEYNNKWTSEDMFDRKISLVTDIQDLITFKNQGDEFDELSVSDMVNNDIERRENLRPSR